MILRVPVGTAANRTLKNAAREAQAPFASCVHGRGRADLMRWQKGGLILWR